MHHQPIKIRTPLALSSTITGSSRPGRRPLSQTISANDQTTENEQSQALQSEFRRSTPREQDEDDTEDPMSLSVPNVSMALDEDEDHHLHFRRAFYSEADLMPNLDDLITHHDDSNLIQSPEATAAPSSNPSTRQPTLSPPPSTSLQAAQRRAFLARKVVRASELTVSAENAVRGAETSFKEALQVIRVTAEDLARAQVELNQARIGWMYYGAHKRKCEAERAKILAEIAELQQIAGSSDGNPA